MSSPKKIEARKIWADGLKMIEMIPKRLWVYIFKSLSFLFSHGKSLSNIQHIHHTSNITSQLSPASLNLWAFQYAAVDQFLQSHSVPGSGSSAILIIWEHRPSFQHFNDVDVTAKIMGQQEYNMTIWQFYDNSGHLRGAQDLAIIAVVSCQVLESDLEGSLHQTHLLRPRKVFLIKLWLWLVTTT